MTCPEVPEKSGLRLERRRDPNRQISFRGKHNRAKVIILTWMVQSGFVKGQQTITAKRLCEITGWSLRDIRPCFSRWSRWGYLYWENHQPTPDDASLYSYAVQQKGLDFLMLFLKITGQGSERQG